MFFVASCAPSLGLMSAQSSFFGFPLISDLVRLAARPAASRQAQQEREREREREIEREWQQGSPRSQAFSSGDFLSPFVLIPLWPDFCARSILHISCVHVWGWVSA